MNTALDTSPFYFAGNGRAAALLVHGFTGTPYEMRGLGERLAEAGITARGIRLPGHERPENMVLAGREDWRAAVRKAFIELRNEHTRVALVGLSMGGLLSLDLAGSEDTVVDAVVSMGAPMFLYGWRARYLLPAVAASPLRTRWIWRKDQPGNIRDPDARERHPSLQWCGVAALDELRCLLRETRRKLPKVKAPALVLHGRHDTTALVQSADILYRRLGSAHKEKVILPQSYHVVTVDVERKRVANEVVRFLQWALHVDSHTARKPLSIANRRTVKAEATGT
jgi:carboxylesterase